MKLKLLFSGLFLCLIMFQHNVHAQKNVFKLSLTPLIIGDISTQYERVFLKKFSVSLGYGYIPERGLPGFIPPIPIVSDLKFSGSSFTPEVRMYPHLLKDAPSGMYIAVYMKYSKYNLDANVPWSFSQDITVQDPNDPNRTTTQTVSLSNTFNLSGSFSGVGYGAMIGKQIVLGGHVTLDIFMLGGHVGTGADLSVSTKTDVINQLPVEARQPALDNLQAQLNKIALPSFIPGTVHATLTETDARLELEKIPFFGVRFLGFCVGFAF